MRIGEGVFHCALCSSQMQNKATEQHFLLCDIDRRRENGEFVCISACFIAQDAGRCFKISVFFETLFWVNR